MDPRLRAAVDTSLAWYDDVFAVHEIPTRTEHGLWWALQPPPPWHSAVKTTMPGVDVRRVLALPDHGAVADSFGDLALRSHGFTVLVDATWVHHPPLPEPPSDLPAGWVVVRDEPTLAQWSRHHDYAGVLLPEVLELPAFTVLARRSRGALVGGAVVHVAERPGHRAVGLSNSWAVASARVDHAELLAAIGTLHPGAPVTAFARGDDLGLMVAAGYTALGPQRVWVRNEEHPDPAQPGRTAW